MKHRCFLFITGLFVIISSGCGKEHAPPNENASQSSESPTAPVKPTDQNVNGTTTPEISGPLTFKVNSVLTQDSYAHFFDGKYSVQAEAGFTFLIVNVSLQNSGTAQETFSSTSFRIVDSASQQVDAKFQGFDKWASGTLSTDSWSSISNGSDTVLKFKGSPDNNDPKNSHFDWELAPGKSHTATFVFAVPKQTVGPRFEMAKK
jgi:hypothetical protein